jgi:broad specificity phosphatase PhoE
MSTLYVVRHGQASFGAADYDRLTPLGVEQATLLGAHLAAEGVRLDQTFVGPRLRQRDTMRHALTAGRAAGATWPDPEELPGLDEYPAEVLARRALPRLLETDEDARAIFASGGAPVDARRFQRVFEKVMRSWLAGELDTDGLETWHEFAGRVGAALRGIMDRVGRGRTALVVTSAGPTSIAAQLALELSDAMALKTSWIVANTGVCDLRFRGAEMTLISFNGLPHLRERRLVTYR